MKSVGDRLIICVIVTLLARAAYAQQPPPPTQPTSQSAASDPQRFTALLGLIEGQNSPQVRQTGASELLRQGWPETPKRLVAILTGADAAAKTAVALALAGAPQPREQQYVEPLLAMLADNDAGARRAAAAALAAYRDPAVLARLKTLAGDSGQGQQPRAAAIASLGMSTDREAVAGLVACLDDASAELRGRALTALENATGQSFNGDVAAAQTWWAAIRDLPLTEWRTYQIDRLASRNRELAQQLGQVRGQLLKTLRDLYLRTPQADRGPLLGSYLTDGEPTVRLLGLELARADLTERQPLSDDALAQIRELAQDSDGRVRSNAIRVVAGLRDPADGERFLRMLESENDQDARAAIVNGLGYVGTAAAVEPLLRLLSHVQGELAAEAAGGLGRLAERAVLDAQSRVRVADALLEKYASVPREQAALRERVVWALSRVGDPRSGEVFAKALSPSEPAPVRQAAALGIDALGDAKLADALLPCVADADAALRKTCVESLGKLGSTDAHVQALWSRISESQEGSAQIRDAAWQGALKILAARPPRDLLRWVQRVPDEGEIHARRGLELLLAAEKALAGGANNRLELGGVRLEIGRRLAGLARDEDAVAVYQKALDDLHAAHAPTTVAAAAELLAVAVAAGRYDERLAAMLLALNPPLDGGLLWEALRPELEKRLTSEAAEQLVPMLEALHAHPPASMPGDANRALLDMLGRARRLLPKSPTETAGPAAESTGSRG